MLKVMIVDDEPYILQGLQVIIDWNKEGFEIDALMSNGKDALNYLKDHEVDLIISDIQMPVMTGLELLETIAAQHLSDAKFVLLTGYDDFSYVQKAIRNNCLDYILKPVSKEDLTALLRKVSNMNEEKEQVQENQKKMEDAYLASNLISIIKGKYDDTNVEYVKNHLQLTGGLRFVDIEIMTDVVVEDEDDYDMRILQKQLFNACKEILKENSNHFIFDVSYDKDNYDVGFIYCENMATRRDMNEIEFFEMFLKKLEVVFIKPLRIMCGKLVPDVSSLSKSYSSCARINSIKGFHNQKNLYFYEEDIQVGNGGIVLCKNSLDECISAIQSNNSEAIKTAVENLYEEMNKNEGNSSVIDLNINYLLFQLIHLATEQDDNVNQEEVVQYISEKSFENSIKRGSCQHLERFAIEYAEYLNGLRKNVSRGILSEIEAEIREHYAENISLRNLGEKFYINSSYLGQIFRKKYNQSFKDYLTNYRINEATKQLLTTDKKVNQIASDVGYKDCDYFIRKFIETQGCTPSKFRKIHEDK
ncbi:MAG: response regulator [Clostridiales bacterium]|nr:response regulator [Clostridiales bacterium]